MFKKSLVITWATHGDITWEDWWIRQYGRTRTKIPSKADYISFVNYDLQNTGCSKILEKNDKLEIRNISEGKIPVVLAILYFHGFEVVSMNDD